MLRVFNLISSSRELSGPDTLLLDGLHRGFDFVVNGDIEFSVLSHLLENFMFICLQWVFQSDISLSLKWSYDDEYTNNNQPSSSKSNRNQLKKQLTSLDDYTKEQNMQVVREIRQEEASVRARINNTKHLTENSRLNDIQLLFSTLEQQKLGEVFQDEDAELDNEIDS